MVQFLGPITNIQALEIKPKGLETQLGGLELQLRVQGYMIHRITEDASQLGGP